MANAVNSSDYAVEHSLARQKTSAANDRPEAELKDTGQAIKQQELGLREIVNREIGRARNISRVV